jgi:hypothetical protein
VLFISFFDDFEDLKVLVTIEGHFIINVYKKSSSVRHKLNLLCNWPVFDTMCMQALLLVFHGYILPQSS